jgi:hypothetical protein
MEEARLIEVSWRKTRELGEMPWFVLDPELLY